ncbi:GTP 3',8-cyclase MoaA [Chlorobium phaeovibrioides]|uniref:GTP 3',8-cyclase MoaA n=1 Tax=Chlorobium phaeovibrioides TaxID=1094 RepID=UPI00123109D9|nr:GTP 3',8-cyclase MoaA [Chlorobium phaeovibrioides]QEQ56622.1 GTP 3',8-cyclase MoaA [Chlorobium phaeovibrioides]
MSRTEQNIPQLEDRFQRRITYARIALTRLCNLRCSYCMREEHESGTAAAMMSFSEVKAIIRALAAVGVKKVRLTGGEPLLRHDIADIVLMAKQTPGIEKVTLTTNGLLLDRHLDRLLEAGIDAINISIDSLQPERYQAITRRDEFARVKSNLDRLIGIGIVPVKVNVVMLRGINDDELPAFIELTRLNPVTVRFMELQPFDDHQIWRTGKFLGMDKIRQQLFSLYPEMEELQGSGTQYFSFRLPNHKGSTAIIPAYTRNFCNRCNRIRITAGGTAMSCLYEKEGVDLLEALRNEAGTDESRNEALMHCLRECILHKPEDGRKVKDAGSSAGTSMSEIGG